MIKILTDSTCDLSEEIREKYNIEMYPLSIFFDGDDTEYFDKVTISNDDFFKRLEKCDVLPKTSQISVLVFKEIFEDLISDGSEIIGIFMSSSLSGTYNNSELAKDMFSKQDQERIHLVDSKNVTLPLGLLVLEAAKARNSGKNVEEIIEEIEYLKENIVLLALIQDLKYLQKGGRLSATNAKIGSTLNLQPIVTLEEGEVVLKKLIRGEKKALKYIRDNALKIGIDYSRPVYVSSVHNDELADKLYDVLYEDLIKDKVKELYTKTTIGSVVGTHTGPNCTGIIFVKR